MRFVWKGRDARGLISLWLDCRQVTWNRLSLLLERQRTGSPPTFGPNFPTPRGLHVAVGKAWEPLLSGTRQSMGSARAVGVEGQATGGLCLAQDNAHQALSLADLGRRRRWHCQGTGKRWREAASQSRQDKPCSADGRLSVRHLGRFRDGQPKH